MKREIKTWNARLNWDSKKAASPLGEGRSLRTLSSTEFWEILVETALISIYYIVHFSCVISTTRKRIYWYDFHITFSISQKITNNQFSIGKGKMISLWKTIRLFLTLFRKYLLHTFSCCDVVKLRISYMLGKDSASKLYFHPPPTE